MGVANLKGTRPSSNSTVPSMSNMSASLSDSLASLLSAEFEAATFRVRVSMAWDMSVFSLAANMVLASMERLLP